MKLFEARLGRLVVSFLFALAWSCAASAQRPEPPTPPSTADLPLFAIEITIGPNWDASKRPQDQSYFREHSVNLKRLRDAGHLVIGARYADKGLVVLAAEPVSAAVKPGPSLSSNAGRLNLA